MNQWPTRDRLRDRTIRVPERKDMTVCIAGVCGHISDCSIIEVADTQISSSLGKSGRLKINPMPGGHNFDVLIAGEDCEMTMVLDHLRARFDARKDPLTLEAVTNLVRDALFARKRDKTEELVQGRHALSYEVFRKSRDQFDPDEYAITEGHIAKTVIEAHFIVSGFAGTQPVVLQTTEKCEVLRRHDFAVIGQGASLAESMMLHRGYHRSMSFEQAFFACIEAKIFAEGKSSVGDSSTLIVRQAGKHPQRISDYGMQWFAKQAATYSTKELAEEMTAGEPLIGEL